MSSYSVFLCDEPFKMASIASSILTREPNSASNRIPIIIKESNRAVDAAKLWMSIEEPFRTAAASHVKSVSVCL